MLTRHGGSEREETEVRISKDTSWNLVHSGGDMAANKYSLELAAAGSTAARPENPQHGRGDERRTLQQLHESWGM